MKAVALALSLESPDSGILLGTETLGLALVAGASDEGHVCFDIPVEKVAT